MVDFLVTDEGPPTFTYEELRADNSLDWRAVFGNDAPTAPDTTDGHLIDLATLPQLILTQNQTRQWADSAGRTARGVALDAQLDVFGKVREPARASTAQLIFYGSASTLVSAGSQAQTPTTSNLFATTADATTGTLAASDTWVTRIPPDVMVGDTVTVTIDVTPYAHLVAGGEGPIDVSAALQVLIVAGSQGVASQGGVDVDGRALLVIDLVPAEAVTASSTGATQPDAFPAARARSTATLTGLLTAPAGTLQVLPVPLAGITGVTTDLDAAVGRDLESDDEFWNRHLDTLFDSSGGTDGGLRSTALQVEDEAGVRFVTYANAVSNRNEDPVDGAGRPLGSVEVIVQLSEAAPSDATLRLAEALGPVYGAGIEPFGLADPLGFEHVVEPFPGNFITVKGSFVVTQYLHLEVTVVPGPGFPTEGDTEQAIREQCANDWNFLAEADRDWNRPVSIGSVAVATAGGSASVVIRSDLTALPTDTPTFADVDTQPATDRDIIELSSNRVTVLGVP